MATNDQPRLDLDAAIEAMLPALTAVSDVAVATSLRRTRVALADAAPARSVGTWGWIVPAAAAAMLALAFSLFWFRPARTPAVASVPDTPMRAPSPTALVASPSVMEPPRLANRPGVRITAAPRPTRPTASPRPDPLAALVRAVQQIPDDAWDASIARREAPLTIPDVAIAPIVVPSIAAAPLSEVRAESIAPGEP